jgi:hypothetical protein
MNKVEEFEHQLNQGPLAEPGIEAWIHANREGKLRDWCHDNRDLIARALRVQEAFDKAPSDVDYFDHEKEYAAKMLVWAQEDRDSALKRGFLEGCRAYERYIFRAVK